jgi:hypothetical protein
MCRCPERDTIRSLPRTTASHGFPLSRMLEKIETALANEKIGAADNSRLRQRAELIRSLLAPWPIT